MPRLATLFAALGATLLLATPGGASLHRSHAARAQYAVVDLGTLGGTTSFATAINRSGSVVGYAATSGDGASHAFLWRHGVMTDLGVLPGGTNSRANAINDRGQIVGSSDALTPSLNSSTDIVASQAFLYSRGKLTDIDPDAKLSYTPGSWAYAINDAGQVVGDVLASSGDSQAFLYSGGSFATLPIVGDEPQARGINRRGAIVGSTFVNTSPPFLFAGGVQTNLGTAPGQAEAINDRGMIAGWAQVAGGYSHAFLDTAFLGTAGTTLTDLGTLGGLTSQANALDGDGRTVGTAQIAGGAAHAFLYQRGAMVDLNALIAGSSGWVLENATGINAGGEIVGVGTINGAEHAFLLVPKGLHVRADG
jgi:probable HAF family extracellular repeat protein